MATSLSVLADGERDRHDLFIGIVAPIGSSRQRVLAGLEAQLLPYGYSVEPIGLSGLLDDIGGLSGKPLPRRGERDYYRARMNAGDNLRRHAGDESALAAMAVARVAELRSARRETASPGSPAPCVYVFDSLKHPREADLLRNVYGSAFWLLSVVEDVADRLRNLAGELADQNEEFSPVPEALAVELVTRDESDTDAAHGQHVRDVFAGGDFFLPVLRGMPLPKELDRFLDGIFDAPFLTPSAREESMRYAQAASLRSAAIGRQVGAAIVPLTGAPLIVGTNEVPKPGGGQYREGDIPDHRDFQSGMDPNPAYTERVIRELLSRLAKAGFFTTARNEAGGSAILREATAKDADGSTILDGTRAKALIEFTRCLHAEQAAIVDAARTGVAIGGATLYTTTFPCHECTKFIIGAGIVEVQYIHPYPKSLAGDLYSDLIDTVPPLDDEAVGEAPLRRVPFRPFVGFGPSRYDDVFVARERRSGTGVAEHDKAVAVPVGDGWSEVAVTTSEGAVVLAIQEGVTALQASEKDEPHVDDPSAGDHEEGPGQTVGSSA